MEKYGDENGGVLVANLACAASTLPWISKKDLYATYCVFIDMVA
jgi:hypothetical protein